MTPNGLGQNELTQEGTIIFETVDQGDRVAIKHWLALSRHQRRDAIRAAASRTAPQLPADPAIRNAMRVWVDRLYPLNLWGLALLGVLLVSQVLLDTKAHRDWAWFLFVCLGVTMLGALWDLVISNRIRRTFRASEAHEN